LEKRSRFDVPVAALLGESKFATQELAEDTAVEAFRQM
jgi:hypothetical protein